METALYLPVKRFLENLGFTAKGEIGGCDVVALKGDAAKAQEIGKQIAMHIAATSPAITRRNASP